MFNTRGEAIGITNMGILGGEALGFAIPAHMVQFVASQAGQGDKIKRPWLGATVQLVNAEIADAMALDRPSPGPQLHGLMYYMLITHVSLARLYV